MDIINKLKKLNIDCSSLGFEQSDCKVTYFCTPKGANIIGWAGVDGIHYCTIRGLGEMIFAVSPENLPDDYVHPIARNFEDLLRLLVSCGDMAAIEQAHAWDKNIFESFIEENKPTKMQASAINELKTKLNVSPIDNPFGYIKKLQAEFDYSKIKYTPEYYDVDMNPYAESETVEWKVTYDGGYWNKGRAGEEFALNSRFAWGDEVWHIPSIYSCGKGLVVDFCVEIKPELLKAFIDKWMPICTTEERLPREKQEQLDNENPLAVEFRPHLYLNGKEITPKHGTSISWIPESCLPYDVENPREAKQIVNHYGLDKTQAWSFHRWSCPWATQRKPKIKSLKLKLERHPASINGIHFKNPSVGDVINFTHPIFNTEYKLTVQEYKQQELSSKAFVHEEYEFPTHHTAMTYTLEPELPNKNFQVRDCLDNDEPKRRPRNPYEPQASYDACSIGIIGGADGPTALIFSKGESIKAVSHAALSALHFEPVSDVEWKIIFREKLTADIEIDLVPERIM